MSEALNKEEVLDIKKNYLSVLEDIRKIASECGRNPDDITLIAVSKTKPIEYVRQAVDAGAADFGENKPQELSQKYDGISDVRWHQIGHLQKNKVRHIVGKAALIHSLDSIPLALEINKRAKNVGIVQDVLIQVNVSGEESKFGISPGELDGFLDEVRQLENIRVTGLMTISVRDYSREQNLSLFSELKTLADKHRLKELSMGMTHDYKEAIEAGATMIRVGTAIFGARDYSSKNIK